MTIIRPCSEGAGYSGGTKLLKLKEIELLGFKSFADRTRLTCDGSTAAIVGQWVWEIQPCRCCELGTGRTERAHPARRENVRRDFQRHGHAPPHGHGGSKHHSGRERRGSGQRRRRIGKGYRNPRNRATRGATARV